MPHTVWISGSWSLSAAYRYLRKFRTSDLFKVEVFKPHIVGLVQNMISWVTFDFMLQLYHGLQFSIWRGEKFGPLGHFFPEDRNTPEKWLWHGVPLSAQRLVKQVGWAVFGCFGRQNLCFWVFDWRWTTWNHKSQLVWNSNHSEFCKGVVAERWDRQNLSGWGEIISA